MGVECVGGIYWLTQLITPTLSLLKKIMTLAPVEASVINLMYSKITSYSKCH